MFMQSPNYSRGKIFAANHVASPAGEMSTLSVTFRHAQLAYARP